MDDYVWVLIILVRLKLFLIIRNEFTIFWDDIISSAVWDLHRAVLHLQFIFYWRLLCGNHYLPIWLNWIQIISSLNHSNSPSLAYILLILRFIIIDTSIARLNLLILILKPLIEWGKTRLSAASYWRDCLL